MRVAVLGAGVVGVASAWYLRRAGHSVVVVDRQPDVARETSFANGGQISVSHAEPWANPRAPLKALAWLGREDAPLLYRWRADPALFAWTLRFLRECTPARTRANIAAILALALHSRQELKALRTGLHAAGRGFDYDQRECGILHIYTEADEFAAATRAADLMRGFGCNRELKSADECVAIEPALADIRAQLVGGDYVPADESGDACAFTTGLAARCREDGVEFQLGATIERLACGPAGVEAAIVDGVPLRADAFVVALGSYTPLLLRPLGLRVPIVPAKGYSATIPLADDAVAPTVSLTDDQYKIVVSRLGQRLRVAGTAEFAGHDATLNAVRCDLLMRRIRSLFPRLGDAGAPTFWAGLRPATPGNVPLIGRTAVPRLWLNSGHGTLGWTLACGSGQVLAEMLSGRRPPIDFPFLGA